MITYSIELKNVIFRYMITYTLLDGSTKWHRHSLNQNTEV